MHPNRRGRASRSRARSPRMHHASYPVFVHRPAALDWASSRPRLAATPLPFSLPSALRKPGHRTSTYEVTRHARRTRWSSRARRLRRVPWSERLGRDKHILHDAFCSRRGKTILTKAIEMELDCQKQLVFSFLYSGSSCDTTWQVRHIPGEIAFGFFDNNRIAHNFNLSVRPASECC